MSVTNEPQALSKISEVITINGDTPGTQKVLIISQQGNVVGEIEGRSTFTTTGSFKSIGEWIEEKYGPRN